MDALYGTYPVFTPNQLLGSTPLNQLRSHADRQTRLTRTHLIGIGLVCGLEARLKAPGTVLLAEGCGVTSAGYLIVVPDDVALAHTRRYTLPDEDRYAPFLKPDGSGDQYDLWELFADDDEPGAVPLAASGLDLDRRALVLFLELAPDDSRSCQPNSCDDGGMSITPTVRRLLVDLDDLAAIHKVAGHGPSVTAADLYDRLALPDLRMPRVDVPNTGPTSTESVLRAFQEAFRSTGLAKATAAALSRLYDAFRPVVADSHPTDPFTGFATRFGFLDTTPVTSAQVRFLPCYWDLFDDLVAAYDEVRWAGLEVLDACCPDEDLFPRHLMAGALDTTRADAASYRHGFLRSPALGTDRTDRFRVLFERLVAMTTAFEEHPAAPEVRATPSHWGPVPLGEKAIPYYFDQAGTPPLYRVWEPTRTRRGRAHQNLAYRAPEFSPTPPAFVVDPLRYDLEPRNFLRVEGHLGRDVREVLTSLLTLKESHRLPIEVVALRTGDFDEEAEFDPAKEKCRFEDLDAAYRAFKAELTCSLVKQVKFFYDMPQKASDLAVAAAAAARPAGVAAAEAKAGRARTKAKARTNQTEALPGLALLRAHAPGFVAETRTMGDRIERDLAWRAGTGEPPPRFAEGNEGAFQSSIAGLVGSMDAVAAELADDLGQIDFDTLERRHHDMVDLAGRVAELGGVIEGGDVVSSRIRDLLTACHLAALKALDEEYKRRIREARKATYLSHFLTEHPGVQHKAGVPLGGTFVLVYHERQRSFRPFPGKFQPFGPREVQDVEAERTTHLGHRGAAEEGRVDLLTEALERVATNPAIKDNPDVGDLLSALTGQRRWTDRPDLAGPGWHPGLIFPGGMPDVFFPSIYRRTVDQLTDGVVVADFFLPYLSSSGCPPIQFRMPPPPLRVTAVPACTNVDGVSEVTVTVVGARGALEVKVDDADFAALASALALQTGPHTLVVRDAEGTESSPVAVTIPPHLEIRDGKPVADDATRSWTVETAVEGGTPPYRSDEGSFDGQGFRSDPVPLGKPLTVRVTDAAGCAAERTFESPEAGCTLPCDGVALRAGYWFWLRKPLNRKPYKALEYRVEQFLVVEGDGSEHPLRDQVQQAMEAVRGQGLDLNEADYRAVAPRWVEAVNQVLAAEFGSPDWFSLEHREAGAADEPDLLMIERLACLEFEIAVLTVDGRNGERLVSYTRKGTVASDSRDETPAMEPMTRNKCEPGSTWEPVS